MTTAGNLVFSAMQEGILYALNATTGEKLWELQLPPGPSTPITYELDGQQYLTILSGPGGRKGLPVGFGRWCSTEMRRCRTGRGIPRIERLPSRDLDRPWDVAIRSQLGRLRHREQRLPLRCEEDLPLCVATDPVAVLVDRPVMTPTQEDEVPERGLTSIGPVPDVVGIGEAEPTAKEAAPTVSGLERTAKRRWDRAGPPTQVKHRAVGRVVTHFDRPRITCQSPGSYRGNSRAVLELGLAGLALLPEGRLLDMEHDLSGLGLLPIPFARLGKQSVTRRLHCTHQDGPHLRSQPSLHYVHPLFIREDREAPTPVSDTFRLLLIVPARVAAVISAYRTVTRSMRGIRVSDYPQSAHLESIRG